MLTWTSPSLLSDTCQAHHAASTELQRQGARDERTGTQVRVPGLAGERWGSWPQSRGIQVEACGPTELTGRPETMRSRNESRKGKQAQPLLHPQARAGQGAPAGTEAEQQMQ